MKYFRLLIFFLLFIPFKNFSMEGQGFDNDCFATHENRSFKEECLKLTELVNATKNMCGESVQKSHYNIMLAQKYINTLQELSSFSLKTLTTIMKVNSHHDLISDFQNAYLFSQLKLLTVINAQGKIKKGRKQIADDTSRRIIHKAWDIIGSWNTKNYAKKNYINKLTLATQKLHIPTSTAIETESNSVQQPSIQEEFLSETNAADADSSEYIQSSDSFDYDMVAEQTQTLINQAKKVYKESLQYRHAAELEGTQECLRHLTQLAQFAHIELCKTVNPNTNSIDSRTDIELLNALQNAYLTSQMKYISVLLINKRSELVKKVVQNVVNIVTAWGKMNFANTRFLQRLNKKTKLYDVKPQTRPLQELNAMIDELTITDNNSTINLRQDGNFIHLMQDFPLQNSPIVQDTSIPITTNIQNNRMSIDFLVDNDETMTEAQNMQQLPPPVPDERMSFDFLLN